MNCRIISAAAAVAACTVLAGCQQQPAESDFAACKQALRAQIDANEPLHGSQMWKRPTACDAMLDETIRELSVEAFQEKMREDIAKEATPAG